MIKVFYCACASDIVAAMRGVGAFANLVFAERGCLRITIERIDPRAEDAPVPVPAEVAP